MDKDMLTEAVFFVYEKSFLLEVILVNLKSCNVLVFEMINVSGLRTICVIDNKLLR